MATAKPITADEFFRLPRDYRCELFQGVVREKRPARSLRGRTVGRLLRALLEQDVEGRIGEVRSGETAFRLDRGTVAEHAADLAVLRGDDADKRVAAPVLVIDVAVWDDHPGIDDAAARYLAAGVGEIWWVQPLDNVVDIVRRDGTTARLGRHDTLESPTLPGFALPLEALFGEAGWDVSEG